MTTPLTYGDTADEARHPARHVVPDPQLDLGAAQGAVDDLLRHSGAIRPPRTCVTPRGGVASAFAEMLTPTPFS